MVWLRLFVVERKNQVNAVGAKPALPIREVQPALPFASRRADRLIMERFLIVLD